MCGRYYIATEEENIEIKMIMEEIRSKLKDSDKINLMKTGEIFPTDFVPVIINKDMKKQPDILKWGIKLDTLKSNVIINARLETIQEKPLFKRMINNRCLIVANAFFEWKKEANKKVKNIILLENKKTFYMAGLYGTFKDKDDLINCFVIITTDANSQMKEIHDRMPVILKDDLIDYWLFDNNSTIFSEISKPFENPLIIKPISK
ncbi:SOS response-associated peptidase [Caldicellulosiruptoraceae bacterium PP1]